MSRGIGRQALCARPRRQRGLPSWSNPLTNHTRPPRPDKAWGPTPVSDRSGTRGPRLPEPRATRRQGRHGAKATGRNFTGLPPSLIFYWHARETRLPNARRPGDQAAECPETGWRMPGDRETRMANGRRPGDRETRLPNARRPGDQAAECPETWRPGDRAAFK